MSNLLLASLSAGDAARLAPHLRRVTLQRDMIVAQEGREIPDAIFPCGCLLSVMTVLSRKRVETCTIAADGALGLLQALGLRTSVERVIVQVGGPALTIPLVDLASAARERPTIGQALAVFAQAAAAQAAVNVACNAVHDTRQRLCRWLLLSADRISTNILPLTQEHLSIMLGVQRTTVTALASELQDRGVIRYSRGHIVVIDRPALLAGACECYELGRRQTQSLLASGRTLHHPSDATAATAL